MTPYQIFVIIVLVLALVLAGVAVYAAVKRRLQLMLIALGLMQVPLGIENLHNGFRWIAYFQIVVGVAILLMALTQRSRFQRTP